MLVDETDAVGGSEGDRWRSSNLLSQRTLRYSRYIVDVPEHNDRVPPLSLLRMTHLAVSV